MEKDLFGRTAKERERQEKIKLQVLLSCEEERTKLQDCFRNTWFGQCSQEHKEFWDCLTRVRNMN